jgi:hypothetical protein
MQNFSFSRFSGLDVTPDASNIGIDVQGVRTKDDLDIVAFASSILVVSNHRQSPRHKEGP